MDDRVLIAASLDWVGTSRLPSTLGAAGLHVHLIDGGDTRASRSSWLRSHTVVLGGPGEIAARLLEVADGFDRVIACDESLLAALAEMDDPRALRILPANPDALPRLLDKTAFPAAASEAGLRVPDWRVARDADGVEAAARGLGRVILKSRYGHGGRGVRCPRPERLRDVATSLGFPVLVERFVDGELALMPCLFDQGRLVAAFAAHKKRTIKRFGPSSVNVLRPVGSQLALVAERAGAAFGLDGFASIDLFLSADDSEPIVIEINPRPVAQLHLGKLVGVDMAQEFRNVVSGRNGSEPVLSGGGGTVALFPLELQRLRAHHGAIGGTLRWAKSPGAIRDVPWNDLPLAWHGLRVR